MVASSTGDCVPATSVRAVCVDTSLARQAWSGMGQTLIYIWWDNVLSKPAHFLYVECFNLSVTLNSPIQLPMASWMKPTVHLSFGWQRNEPAVLVQKNSGPQLWIPKVHSSMSGTGKEEKHFLHEILLTIAYDLIIFTTWYQGTKTAGLQRAFLGNYSHIYCDLNIFL